MRQFSLFLAVASAALWCGIVPAPAQEGYVLGEDAEVFGEAFCASAQTVMEVAKAYRSSRDEGEKVEQEKCEVPIVVLGVDARTGLRVGTYQRVKVRLVRVVKAVRVGDSKLRVTFIEVSNTRGKVFYMSTYLRVTEGAI